MPKQALLQQYFRGISWNEHNKDFYAYTKLHHGTTPYQSDLSLFTGPVEGILNKKS